MDELVYWILKEIEDSIGVISIHDLIIDQKTNEEVLTIIEKEEYIAKDCFSHGGNGPIILRLEGTKLKPAGVRFLREYEEVHNRW